MRSESDQTNQIVRYLDQHFLKEIGVEDLARTFHMSKSSLNKFFQKQLNTTCHQYILKKRLALAVSLIQQDVPLKTVAVQSGFGDYSSFFVLLRKCIIFPRPNVRQTMKN
ncbi:MAG: helix-turn-helix domain-containing protein [Coprococcus sp.]